MTLHEFLKIRTDLCLSRRELGRWINPNAKNMYREIARWESGARTVPGYIDVMMCMFKDGCVPVHIKDEEKPIYMLNLVDAAPELLKALEKFNPRIIGYGMSLDKDQLNQAWRKAETLILKIKGEK